MEAIKEKINKAKISNNVKKNLSNLIDDKNFDLNLKQLIENNNKLFEPNRELFNPKEGQPPIKKSNKKNIKIILKIIIQYRDVLFENNQKDSKIKYLDRFIGWTKRKWEHVYLNSLIKNRFITLQFEQRNNITADAGDFLKEFLKKDNFLADKDLSIDVGKTLIKIIILIVQDCDISHLMNELGCYMRGDDKNYGLMHTNSTFTHKILLIVQEIKNNIKNQDKKKYLEDWMTNHATKKKRFLHVSSLECGETANKRKLPKRKLPKLKL